MRPLFDAIVNFLPQIISLNFLIIVFDVVLILKENAALSDEIAYTEQLLLKAKGERKYVNFFRKL